MSNLKAKKPYVKTIVLQIDPYESAARFVVGKAPEGYAFWSLVRKGTRAVVKYRRLT